MKAFSICRGCLYPFRLKRTPTLSIAFQNSSKDPIRRFQDFLPMKDHSYQLVSGFDRCRLPFDCRGSWSLVPASIYLPHGMASMVASGIYQFSMEEVIGLLTGLSISHQRNGSENDSTRKCAQSYGQTKVLKGIELQIQRPG